MLSLSKRGLQVRRVLRRAQAAADGCDRCRIQVRPADVADGIVVGHIEGIIGAHEDFVGAVELHNLLQLMRCEHHRVEVDLPEVVRCECTSIVVLLGLASRPGRTCRRAAVGPYLFHWVMHRSLQNPSAFRRDVVNPLASFLDSVTLLGYTFAILQNCIDAAAGLSRCLQCTPAAAPP
jgi:hypothetical protein